MIEKLKKIINKIDSSVATDEINEKTHLYDDLNFDSITMIMLSVEIEEEFGFKFSEMVKFETVGEVCNYIEERVKQCAY